MQLYLQTHLSVILGRLTSRPSLLGLTTIAFLFLSISTSSWLSHRTSSCLTSIVTIYNPQMSRVMWSVCSYSLWGVWWVEVSLTKSFRDNVYFWSRSDHSFQSSNMLRDYKLNACTTTVSFSETHVCLHAWHTCAYGALRRSEEAVRSLGVGVKLWATWYTC